MGIRLLAGALVVTVAVGLGSAAVAGAFDSAPKPQPSSWTILDQNAPDAGMPGFMSGQNWGRSLNAHYDLQGWNHTYYTITQAVQEICNGQSVTSYGVSKAEAPAWADGCVTGLTPYAEKLTDYKG